MPPFVMFLCKNHALYEAISECPFFLHESVASPTHCQTLTMTWQDMIGVTDALSTGIGGIIGEECVATSLTVCCMQWSGDITQAVNSDANPRGTTENSNLEVAILLLWFLMIEIVVGDF